MIEDGFRETRKNCQRISSSFLSYKKEEEKKTLEKYSAFCSKLNLNLAGF